MAQSPRDPQPPEHRRDETADDWGIHADAIVEQPRSVRKHPLLSAIYERHDELIGEHLRGDQTLELAFGRYMHPDADVGLEAWPDNAHATNRPAVTGDARSLPFDDDSFDAVIGRRFLHHVPEEGRREILSEAARVLKPGGRIVILEGTPGLYRKLAKGIAFKLGVLGDDSDVYGHCSRDEIAYLVDAEFDVVEERALGSPLMPASITESELSRHLLPAYERTQFVTWWTLVVGEVTE